MIFVYELISNKSLDTSCITGIIDIIRHYLETGRGTLEKGGLKIEI